MKFAAKSKKDDSVDVNRNKSADKTGMENKSRGQGKFSKKSDGKHGQEKKQQKKKALTVMDKMRRRKVRKEKRTNAKKQGKRANKPRKC